MSELYEVRRTGEYWGLFLRGLRKPIERFDYKEYAMDRGRTWVYGWDRPAVLVEYDDAGRGLVVECS